MTGIVAHTYPEWRLKLAGQVAHWNTDYSSENLLEKIATVSNSVIYDFYKILYRGIL